MDVKLNEQQRFNKAVTVVLHHEGRLSDNENDPGGITNWGISLRFLKAHGLDLDLDGDADSDDIRILTRCDAITLFRFFWWEKYNYNAINDLMICTKTFDLAVNMPANTAHKLLQIAVNRLRNKPIEVDGIIGNETLNAVNEVSQILLHEEFKTIAKNYYTKIVANNPSMSWALGGWLNRAAW